MTYGTLIAFAPMIFAAGLYLGSLTGRRPRKRLAEIKALMLKQDRALTNYTEAGRSSCYEDLWDLVAPAEED